MKGKKGSGSYTPIKSMGSGGKTNAPTGNNSTPKAPGGKK